MKEKKGKIVITITIGIACFVLAMIIFMQFKIAYETDEASIETMRVADLQTELANWKSKYEEVNAKYEDTVETLNKYKEEKNSDKKVKENLEDELKNLNLILGKTNVEGKGIIITLKEGTNISEEIDAINIQLLRIVNALRDAGAEAISINEQRVVNQTDFALINNSFVRINSQRIVAPYTIKAIGDPDYLKSALLGTGGYVEVLKTLGQNITIDEKNKIQIQKYSKDMTENYIQENK